MQDCNSLCWIYVSVLSIYVNKFLHVVDIHALCNLYLGGCSSIEVLLYVYFLEKYIFHAQNVLQIYLCILGRFNILVILTAWLNVHFMEHLFPAPYVDNASFTGSFLIATTASESHPHGPVLEGSSLL